MTPARRRRLWLVGLLLLGVSAAAALGTTAFRKNMMYFYTPSDLVGAAQDKPAAGARLRLGGLVEKGSLKRGDGLRVDFSLADCKQNIRVSYEGILPDLFREGQGTVAIGQLNEDGSFRAEQVLAKHDENYMPPELAKSLTDANGKHSCAEFKSVMQAQRKS